MSVEPPGPPGYRPSGLLFRILYVISYALVIVFFAWIVGFPVAACASLTAEDFAGDMEGFSCNL